MGDYGYNTMASRHRPPNSGYFNVPQHYELEVCRMPDWHVYTYRERFSSSSFADSESEEEMSKRAGNRALMGPPQLAPKVRRGGTARSGDHNYHTRMFADRRGGQPMVSHGRGSQHPQFSHSSSDDEVFLDTRPMRHRAASSAILRGPPPVHNLDRFVPRPHHTADQHPAEYGRREPYFHQRRYEQARFGNETPTYKERPRLRERHHSVPARGRDSSRGRDPSRGRDHSRGREQTRGRATHEPVTVENFQLPPSSTESSDEGSLHQQISGSDEFEYKFCYGYQDRHSSSRDSKPSSGTSTGSSSSGYRYTAGNKGATTSGRAKGPTLNRGFLTGKPASDKWSVVTKPRSGHQGTVNGTMHPQHGRPSPVQNVMKHQPLPPGKPNNVLHMHHINQGVHSLAKLEIKPDLSEMSIAEKLHRFMLFVRHESSARINDIQTIENAITGCHLDLKTFYEAEDVGVYQGRHTFSGKLMLSGIFLARAVGQVKRELKHECYKLALQVLRTKSVAEILKQHDIGIEAIRQKFEECSSADTDSSVSDAVVNLASAAPIAVAVETVATTEERWVDFINYLKGLNPDMGNTISRIELAISGSRCGLERQYVDTTIMDQYQGKPGFQGSLTIGGVLQAQGQGTKKKEAKQKTYDVAYQRFTTLEVADILKGVEPQNFEEFKKEKSINVIVKEIHTAEHIKKFELFIDRIKDSSVREGPVTLLDLTANQLQLLITCMYKKMEDQDGPTNLCQLFVGDILISEGEGRHKKEAQADAYSKAYEILISTPVETLITESHRLNKEELQGADVQDVVVKGQIKKEESNLPRLRQQFLNVEEALSEKMSDEMVLVEHQDWIHDRKRHAFCILQNSALLNVMLLKWCTEIETGFFTCRVQLQGEELGMAKAHSRQQARNLASADALFKMYETQPVLRIINADHSGCWITRAQLMEKVQQIPESDFKEADEEWHNYLLKQSSKSEGEDSSGDNVELSDEQKEQGKLERRLRVVAVKEVEEFQQRGDILDEVVFAPDLPQSVRRHLTTIISKMGLRSAQCQKDGKIYLTIQFRARVDKVVAAMQERGLTQTSRFMLVEDRSSLPCHADIAEEIEAARTLTRQDRFFARMANKTSADKDIRDAATGNSMNGSLFEETMEGFVTAQSYMITDANASLQPPKVQSTPQTSPTKKGTPSKRPNTPAEQVYTKFARAMMASGIGQTLVPMESSTPVGSNILINPPKSDNLSGNGGAPVIKNILMSPPRAGSSSVTISSPMKNLTLSSSASSFPQPDFSTSATPVKDGQKPQEHKSSSCSTVSPNSSASSGRHSPSTSGRSQPLTQQLKPALIPGQRQTNQPRCSKPVIPPPPLPPKNGVAVIQSSTNIPSQNCIAKPNPNSNRAVSQKFMVGHSAQNTFPNYGRYAHNNPASFVNGNGNNGGYYGNNFRLGQGGLQPQQQLPLWRPIDPSAPHSIQISPAANYGGFHAPSKGFPPEPNAFSTAMYVENEVPTQPMHGRRWNHYNNPV